MNAILATVLTVAISVGVLSLLIIWARSFATDLGHASSLLDASYAAAQTITRDPDIPESVLDFTSFFAGQAGQPRLARRIAVHSVLNRFRGVPEPQSVTARAFRRDIEGLKPKQAEAFANMVVTGSLASAAADPFFSRVFAHILRMILVVNSSEKASVQGANSVAVDIATHSRAPALVAA